MVVAMSLPLVLYPIGEDKPIVDALVHAVLVEAPWVPRHSMAQPKELVGESCEVCVNGACCAEGDPRTAYPCPLYVLDGLFAIALLDPHAVDNTVE